MKFESFPQSTSPEETLEQKPENEVKVPFMITWGMKQQLADLGYSADSRNELNPEQAHSIIDNQKVFDKKQETDKKEISDEGQEKPEALTKEQASDLESRSQFTQKEIDSLTETIESTKVNINEIRGRLDLPPTKEDPSSVSVLRERLEKLEAEQETLKSQKEVPEEKKEMGVENFEENNKEQGRATEGKEKDREEKERPEKDFEKRRKIIEKIKNNIIEGFNISKRGFSESCEKYSDLFNLLKKVGSSFQEKYPEVIGSETLDNITEKNQKSEELFDKIIDCFRKNEMFLLFNVASLEKLLYLNSQQVSPEKLREIQEATSVEKLEEINSSVEDYFEDINDIANRWNASLRNLESTVRDFNIEPYKNAEKALRFSKGKDKLLTLIDSGSVLNEYQIALSNTPEIRNEGKNDTEDVDKKRPENENKSDNDNEETEYVSYQVGTRKKKGPEDVGAFREIKKKKI
jgi:hypothetical protein